MSKDAAGGCDRACGEIDIVATFANGALLFLHDSGLGHRAISAIE
jgi:hypothetical protein